MKRITHITVILLLALLPSLATAVPSQSVKAELQIILVEATNKGTGIDAGLKSYASNFQRLFRFDSYTQVQRSSANLSLPGESKVSLNNGTTLAISASNGGPTLLADLEWKRGGSSLLHTRLKLKRGTPAVLGGPRSKDGNYLLIITWKK
ncbi:MAG: hypothetical protein ACSHX8_06780 [Opitutaceae bacterium]